MTTTFTDLIEKLTDTLDVVDQKKELIEMTKDFDLSKANPELLDQINTLISTDAQIRNFENKHILNSGDEELAKSFQSLKKNLVKMEVLLYKNTIDKFNIVSKVKNIASNPMDSSKTNEILKIFINALNQKVGSINDILEKTTKISDENNDSNLVQKGGSIYIDKKQVINLSKYFKYKRKYINLKFKKKLKCKI
tara:strand:- start:120 stop:701 length:582 start_codon:yes stop_codon:yes gene_type:complete